MQREMLQSGKFRIFKDEGSGEVDASSEIIGGIGANITELDSLLAWISTEANRPNVKIA